MSRLTPDQVEAIRERLASQADRVAISAGIYRADISALLADREEMEKELREARERLNTALLSESEAYGAAFGEPLGADSSSSAPAQAVPNE